MDAVDIFPSANSGLLIEGVRCDFLMINVKERYDPRTHDNIILAIVWLDFARGSPCSSFEYAESALHEGGFKNKTKPIITYEEFAPPTFTLAPVPLKSSPAAQDVVALASEDAAGVDEEGVTQLGSLIVGDSFVVVGLWVVGSLNSIPFESLINNTYL